jgi:RNA 2',3'-cyclic 3'-phosphodiesterase
LRLFVAIYPPPEVLEHVATQAAELRIGQAAAGGVNVRLAVRDNLHITVAFLGEVADARLPDVHAALATAAATWRRRAAVTADADPPQLRLAGGGRFGRGRFTVLWVGLDGAVDALSSLTRAVRRQLKHARLPYDRRPFRPHLTLARPGDRVDRKAIEADRAALNVYRGPPWPLAEMVLVRSHLGPRPRYDRLGSWSL